MLLCQTYVINIVVHEQMRTPTPTLSRPPLGLSSVNQPPNVKQDISTCLVFLEDPTQQSPLAPSFPAGHSGSGHRPGLAWMLPLPLL